MTTPLPDESEEWVDTLLDAVISEAKACGWFERVQGSELTSSNAPGHGLTCSVWVQRGPRPVPRASGLDKTSAVLTLLVRIYTPSTAQPQDEIDPAVTKAVSALMRQWHDDYDFGLHPLVRNVDLLGLSGQQLDSNAGYVEVGGAQCRVMTITLPIILNDVWTYGSGSAT